MVEFKLTKTSEIETLHITLDDEQLYLDTSYLQTIKGTLKFIQDLSKTQTLLRYYKYGGSSLIPKIAGSGRIDLKPILGHFNILELNAKHNQNLICDKEIFVASESSVNFSPQLTLNLKTLLSSLPLRSHHISGNGKIILYSKGPVQAIELNNQKMAVYSGDVLAYSDSLQRTQTVSQDGVWGLSKKNKTIIEFFGRGMIYVVSYTNFGYLLANTKLT